MSNKKTLLYIGVAVVVIALVVSVVYADSFAFSLLIGVFGVITVLFTLFERKNTATETIVLIAILSSLAAVGRIIFASIPSVQPSSFIVIVTGMVFGPHIGFIVGSICALVSNFILGHGPWTIWQIFCWGCMGLISGVLSRGLKRYKSVRVIYGFLWGFLFGYIMNLWFLISGYGDTFNFKATIAAFIASSSMDFAHGISNALLLLFAGDKFISMLFRISGKYGLNK